MRLTTTKLSVAFVLALALLATPANAQFFRAIENFFRPINNFFSGMFRPIFGPRFHDDGTQRPQATGRDELFPTDCGRDPDKGTGKLCFPDGLLCQRSKFFFNQIFLCQSRSEAHQTGVKVLIRIFPHVISFVLYFIRAFGFWL